MAFGAALPKGIELRTGEFAATFVVPAPNGCNLNCPFCVVRARREALPGESTLAVNDYLQFLNALSREVTLGLVSLQGYEPLLPESWGYSATILAAANALGVPTAIITNGTHLAGRVADLVELKIGGITVSLDSSVPELHDIARRTPGAFALALAGLRAACASPLREHLIVASILQPGKEDYLTGMPELLKALGVEQWVVTPLYNIRSSSYGGPVDSYDRIVLELVRLQTLAKEHGIEMLVDDEFRELANRSPEVVSMGELRWRRLKRLEQVLRLGPNGFFSIGREILRRVGNDTPVWSPRVESADTFVHRTLNGKAAWGARVMHS